ncbi:HvfC family RiPP maturation protein [Nitrincola alkalisediminis]|uniref:HvfC family RiPP maturation protein n=1 Tax=Nitrincola alkalisediminis TaxID=1366656 RepID=UPI001875496D|nr:putative DNA-binding domain-containing protein [Nitrincola alkalisediminis]
MLQHNPPAYAEHLLKLTHAIRNPEEVSLEIEPRRLEVYQRLFFNNINNFVSSAFPVFKQIVSDEWWLNEIRGFMSNYRCQSPRFYDIAEQFLDYLQSDVRPSTEQDPPFMHELMRYEWLELFLELADAEFDGGETPQLNYGINLSPLSLLEAYSYPVHLINRDNQPTEPSLHPTFLLVYRNRNDKIVFEHLNPFSAHLFALISDQPETALENHLQQIAIQFGLEPNQHFLNQGLSLVQGWHDRDVLSRARGESS